MNPEDYIPLCEALGWPEWGGVRLRKRLRYDHRRWQIEVVSPLERASWTTTEAFIALCILERWAREKLYEAGYYIAPSDAAYELFTVDRDEWVESMEAQETEADAQIAALKTLCKETDDGDA